MKRFALLIAVALGLCASVTPVRSQAPAAGSRVQLMKENNAKLLEAQEAALLKLEELQKDAYQLRVFARRT